MTRDNFFFQIIQGILILFQKKFELLLLPLLINEGIIVDANIGSKIENIPDPNVIFLLKIFDLFIISKFLLISLTCLSDNLIILFLFKALLIPCEAPVDNPDNPIVYTILGKAGLIILKASPSKLPIPSPIITFLFFTIC